MPVTVNRSAESFIGIADRSGRRGKAVPMGVGRLSLVCWAIFLPMCVAFMPLAIAIERFHAIPDPARTVLAVVVVGLVWWVPGCYGIYLAVVVIGNGDPWLRRHGVRGGALVLSVRPTVMLVQSGGLRWNTARIYRYRLRVGLPGRAPYETRCY